MTPLAREHNAINMSQGYPDFETPEEITERICHYIRKGMNQYAPMPGLIQLRKALSEKQEKLQHSFFCPESEITITSGATQAIYTAITAFVRPLDEVIVFEPVFDTYVPAIELCGGIAVRSRLLGEEFSYNWGEVAALINERTRMIIINSPHNPSGNLISNEDMISLSELVKGKDIFILSDEVHEHIVYEPFSHYSISAYPELKKRGIIAGSFGKTFSLTGWKTGYCLAPKPLTEAIRNVHQNVVFACNHPVQWALADLLKKDSLYTELGGFYDHKRKLFLKGIEGTDWKPLPSGGTFFQLLDYSRISGLTDREMAIQMTKENKLASIPLSPFYKEAPEQKILRFCFAKKDETLIKVSEILCKLSPLD